MAPQEVIHLIAENFGVAFMPKGIAEQMAGTEIVARPFAARSLEPTSYLALRADQGSRLVNEFGRAFFKRITPNGQQPEASGQLFLNL
jgi:hypothetical protein